MKLDRLMSGVSAAIAVASLLACGCSSTATRAANSAAQQAMLDERTATTQLMSAQVAGPAPKVGKSHVALEGLGADETDSASDTADELGAPKDARRSDGSRRGGHFGTSK